MQQKCGEYHNLREVEYNFRSNKELRFNPGLNKQTWAKVLAKPKRNHYVYVKGLSIFVQIKRKSIGHFSHRSKAQWLTTLMVRVLEFSPILPKNETVC